MKLVNTDFQEIKKITVNDLAIITFYDHELAQVAWLPRESEISKSDMLKIRDAIGEESKGGQLGVYTSTFAFMNPTREAMKYGSTEDANKYTYANAVLVDNLAKKMLYNFFLKMSTHARPIKAFTSRKDAFEWLMEIKPNP